VKQESTRFGSCCCRARRTEGERLLSEDFATRARCPNYHAMLTGGIVGAVTATLGGVFVRRHCRHGVVARKSARS
jgi:hypothetical protein